MVEIPIDKILNFENGLAPIEPYGVENISQKPPSYPFRQIFFPFSSCNPPKNNFKMLMVDIVRVSCRRQQHLFLNWWFDKCANSIGYFSDDQGNNDTGSKNDERRYSGNKIMSTTYMLIQVPRQPTKQWEKLISSYTSTICFLRYLDSYATTIDAGQPKMKSHLRRNERTITEP